MLSNKHLHSEILDIYTALNHILLPSNNTPVISVDWSCLSYASYRYLLRASISCKGRSFVCYQEVRPGNHENNNDAHLDFLKNLKAVLPSNIKPIIVTDAVFSPLWFKQVLSFGWEFVGRARQNRRTFYSFKNDCWKKINEIYKSAKNKASCLGSILLTKKNKLKCRMVTYKKTLKGRKKMNCKGTVDKGSYSIRNSESHREPWILVTSLSNTVEASKVVKYYAKRMQIEEEFRDTKSTRYGFGLSESMTKIHVRVAVLLIINQLASLLCWVIACYAVHKKLHTDYHSNSLKSTNVLSAITLGKRVFRKIKSLSAHLFRNGFKLFIKLIARGEYCVS